MVSLLYRFRCKYQKKHLKTGIENFLAVLAKAYLFLCIYVIYF